MRLSTAAENYIHSIRGSLSLNTQRAYEGDLKAFVKMAPADKITAFTPALVAAFFKAQSDKQLAKSTQLRQLAAITALRDYMRSENLLGEEPLIKKSDKLIGKKPKLPPDPYSDEEIRRLLAVPLTQQGAVMRGVMFYAGLRVSEVARLRWDHVAPKSETQRGQLTILGKGNKLAKVPVLEKLERLLVEYGNAHPAAREANAFLFDGRKGAPLATRTIAERVKVWGQAAKVKRVHPHRFRHSCATILFHAGAEAPFVQIVMRHENIATTLGYMKISDARFEEALRKVDAGFAAADSRALAGGSHDDSRL